MVGDKVPKIAGIVRPCRLLGLADCGKVFVFPLGMVGAFLEDFEQGSDRIFVSF